MRKWLLGIIILALLAGSGTNTYLYIQQNNRINQVDKSISGLLNNITSVQNGLTALQGNVSTLGNSVSSLSGNIGTLGGQITALEGTASGLSGDVGTLKGNITTIDRSINTVNGNITSVNNSLAGLSGSVNSMQSSVAALQAVDRAVLDVVAKLQPAVVMIEAYIPSLRQSAWGSGFIVRRNGYVVTNYHVIEGSNSVFIYLASGERLSASVIASNQIRDVAIIKINSIRTDFPTATLGSSSSTQTGEEVIAIGYPYIADWQVFTKGIISAKPHIGGFDWIQIDAAVNHGNSGGPLVNLRGEVIGINTLGSIDNNVENFNLSIPIDDAKSIIQSAAGS